MNSLGLNHQSEADEITAGSDSNLALAFVFLSPERRSDMRIFYAFCRVVDDIADSPTLEIAEKQTRLTEWKAALTRTLDGEPSLAAAVRDLMARYDLDPALFEEIIAGVEMDLHPVEFETFEDLEAYCYKVAGVVGLVSIEIFGCTDPRSRDYAINLGLALQITNILRDVKVDYDNERRVYLPREDMRKFGVTGADIAAGNQTDGFLKLMEYEAERAHRVYRRAVDGLPVSDRKALRAAELMRKVYFHLLQWMERDGFRVFEGEYQLSKFTKLRLVATSCIRSFFC